ncbi:Pls/PosA family non-ribosomal peptide synthetase [Streptomyces rhizosphaerihabitans]|uniref:Pls/PosA family non-ribosomal peptide synthetase n=1 Tax=Streptomyces rhizosphaerihabitans TaxID=1266770 RepID=UPI0021BFA4A3|nr:Pls/PosA family non-ribosomal peptide synthetase [Streptomyces rhizosphaerihabitans]MCT9008989.1 phosphopantetheine-binding protein [Streptomyces rhizosphaerihabitans]
MTGKQVATLSQSPRNVVAGRPVADALSQVLADVMHLDQVAADSHFFNDLGADSLIMARFCARVRKHPDLGRVSMRDVYTHPSIGALALAMEASVPAYLPEPSIPCPSTRSLASPTGKARYVVCGALQLLAFVGYSGLIAFVSVQGYGWISAGAGLFDVYLRSVLFGAAVFLGLSGLPVAVKWVLIRRWKPQQIRIWSLAYFRFWIVKTLVRSDPLVLFVGSPLYTLYLKALGARIGSGVAIFSRNMPLCTDLLTIGDSAVIRKDSFFGCYRAQGGLIQTGTVTLGKDTVVAESSVLDIETSLGDGARLAHASALHSGQAVPAGEHWHGSPAQRAGVEYEVVGPVACGALRRSAHGTTQLLSALLLYLPLAVGGIGILLAEAPQLSAVLQPGPTVLTTWAFYRDALAVSFVLLFVITPLGFLLLATLPRLLSRTITPDRIYPLYGFHYGVHRAIALLTNRRFLTRLFGDSSGIVPYLWLLGYDLSRVEQTGSNFGTEVKHETPYLSSVGTGTMVADGLSINNAEFSSTSFRVSRATIGARNFLGNRIAYPSRGRTGDNCLLATKVMVPVDGRIREDVGLLGSPSFEIPRSVRRDGSFDLMNRGEALRSGLAAKNRHNAASMVLYLLARWFYAFVVTMVVSGSAELYTSIGAEAVALGNVLVVVVSAVYFVLVERAITAFHPPGPLFCSIYDRRFWRRERYWKVPSETYLQVFNGTPFKSVIWRLLGVRIGRRVFDDGCYLTERTMVTIGDEATLNVGSVVQCHSQEDGTFKSDRSTLGSRCTLGVGAFVHYGVTIGDGAVLAPDSFLMKGETVPQDASWGGNPARQIRPGSAPEEEATR